MKQNKALLRNVLPSTACLATTTTTSPNHAATWGRGIRFWVTITSVTAAGGTDTLWLCGVPPASQSTGLLAGTAVNLAGFSAANLLSVVGTYCFDFYPGTWQPSSGLATGGALKGATGIDLPLTWAVAVTYGTGNAGTVVIDAELLP